METKVRTFKNIRLLIEAGVIDQKAEEKMEYAARQHKQFSGIEFKVLSASDTEAVIRISQGKSAAGNYQDKKRLVEIVHETFDRFFPEKYKINVRPIPYEPPASSVVTTQWLNKKMTELKIGQKDLINDLGMNKVNVSQFLSGQREMSSMVQNLFYYYFLYRELAA